MIHSPRLSYGGFSLVEVTLALAIGALALISLIGLLPQAMKDAGDSTDQTAIGLILEDVHDRIEGSVLKEGPISSNPYFYDQRGIFFEISDSGEENTLTERYFRAEAELLKIKSSTDSTIDGMYSVKVDLYWPLDESGNPISEKGPGTSITYFTAAKTGPEWENIDPEYEPKIEY